MFRKRIIETLKTVPIRAWLIPGVCIGLSYLLNNVALSMTDATSVAFLRSLSVVITPAFAFLIYKNKYKWQHILIQVLVLPGMYLLCVRGGLSGFGAGEVIALLAAALMAGALVFSKNYLDTVDPVSMTALQAACSALLAFAGSLIVEGGIHLENTTPVAWLIIVYLAVLCTFLGYLMQNLALTRIDGRTVSLIQCICPVMTAIFAFIMLGEHLSTAGIIGAIIIVGCIIAGAKN
jgi:drug/metabolite transporter (DMT)-like permease